MPTPITADTGTVTTIVQHHVKLGSEKLFEAWSADIRAACRTFPGYLGTEVIRPEDEEGIFISIFRFDSYGNLEAWMKSDLRQALLKDAEAFCAAPPRISRYRSLEFMFPPGDGGKPPSREKMAVVTFLGLIAPVYLVPGFVEAYITTQPLLATLASLAIITPSMVYIIMPILIRLFRPWLRK
ncbi:MULTISPECIES: antibiotic biosynthesis monooxygenase [Kordiimonas]|jgi:hypothetical protein|uniref:antibiotic biosynthesis monooxygenase n=1 Tax=Kordiimonas TaxID=288021 RepID=UPI00257BF237|nr:antibiotic biosynthesis monooxygenase [Kordiimonas sp. UBA4487]